jgi:hypothetical protein
MNCRACTLYGRHPKCARDGYRAHILRYHDVMTIDRREKSGGMNVGILPLHELTVFRGKNVKRKAKGAC